MEPTPIADTEWILRHIPGGTLWQGSPANPRVTSNNFKLRADLHETGISVSRSPPTRPDELLNRIGNPVKGSRVASAVASAIRSLGLEIASVPIHTDLSHAEIRSGAADLNEQDVRRQLAAVFNFC